MLAHHRANHFFVRIWIEVFPHVFLLFGAHISIDAQIEAVLFDFAILDAPFDVPIDKQDRLVLATFAHRQHRNRDRCVLELRVFYELDA